MIESVPGEYRGFLRLVAQQSSLIRNPLNLDRSRSHSLLIPLPSQRLSSQIRRFVHRIPSEQRRLSTQDDLEQILRITLSFESFILRPERHGKLSTVFFARLSDERGGGEGGGDELESDSFDYRGWSSGNERRVVAGRSRIIEVVPGEY